MLKTEVVRPLTLSETLQTGRLSSITAASGLVEAGEMLYVISDDENHLAVFPKDGKSPGRTIRLFKGELPLETEPRKKKKADLEALFYVSDPFYPSPGALIALPSGSKENRTRAALIALDGKSPVKPLDLKVFFTFLGANLASVNIEGAAQCGTRLCLLNRGNKGKGENALLILPLQSFFDSYEKNTPIQKTAVTIHKVDLGKLGGVPLSFTDAAALGGDRLLFSAVAEDTSDSYNDGESKGSVVGIMDLQGKIVKMEPLDLKRKIEGISGKVIGNQVILSLVNDEDDAKKPSELLKCNLTL